MANDLRIYSLVGESVLIEGVQFTLAAIRGSWAWFESPDGDKLSMRHDEALELLS